MKSDNFVVITFDDQTNAVEASHKLQDLAVRGDIMVDYTMMLKKNEKGEVEVMKRESTEGKDAWSGTFIGMLTGMFLGPVGFLITTLAGSAIGTSLDYSDSKFNAEFTELVKGKLEQGKIAIVANMDEQNPAFLDEAMKPLNGTVNRTKYEHKKEA